jgi:hypothetical protein
MTTKKHSNTHTAASGKKKSAAKASKTGNKRRSKRKRFDDDLRELHEMTLKMFQMVYDDYQSGKFHRIL